MTAAQLQKHDAQSDGFYMTLELDWDSTLAAIPSQNRHISVGTSRSYAPVSVVVAVHHVVWVLPPLAQPAEPSFGCRTPLASADLRI